MSGLGRSLSGARSWLVLAILSVAGIGTSSYLTYSHYADKATVCGGIGSCEFVQTSKYSDMAGVPVALMGLLFFVLLAGLSISRLARLVATDDWSQPVALSLSLGGTAFVAYLTYVELFVIDAICMWCVATAGLTVACLVTTIWGAVSNLANERTLST